MKNEERWNLRNVPQGLKKAIQAEAKRNQFESVNEFVFKILEDYLIQTERQETKDYFAPRVRNLDEDMEILNLTLQKNSEVEREQNRIFNAELKKMRQEIIELHVQLEAVQTSRGMYLGFNCEENYNLALLYRSKFQSDLPHTKKLMDDYFNNETDEQYMKRNGYPVEWLTGESDND